MKVKELCKDVFEKYGVFADMTNPAGCKIGSEPVEFYRDMVLLQLPENTAAFSVCRVIPRELRVTELEYHNFTPEGMLPIDGDVYLPLAPASNTETPDLDSVDIFRVPKGTFISIRKGVWHCGAFAANGAAANVLIVLPERTYFNDCHVVQIDSIGGDLKF